MPPLLPERLYGAVSEVSNRERVLWIVAMTVALIVATLMMHGSAS